VKPEPSGATPHLVRVRVGDRLTLTLTLTR
jgi:hypothetical protein